MANKFMAELMKHEGAVRERVNPFLNVLETSSPSVNQIFGNSWGLPLGYTAVLYGPPKGGKTVLSNMLIGKLHQTDPDALVVKFDTEYRTEGQLTDESAKMFGIDWDRLVGIQTNTPDGIFDYISDNIAAICEKGAPVKLVIIDSLYGITGRREIDAESVSKQIIGDHAATIQNGLKRILHVQRKHKFALLLIDQVRAEMDQTEIMRGNRTKMRSSLAVQHHAEYFIAIEQNKNKAGRVDIHGKGFVNEASTDMAGNGETTGVKIRVKMKDSSMGPKGRSGEFTFDFKKGVINIHEEVFTLGVNRGVIEKPSMQTYAFAGQTWRGKDSLIQALAESPILQGEIVKEMKRRDLAGDFAKYDVAAVEEDSE